MNAAPPLVLHVVFRLATGGLENGLVNLVNRMPSDRYRHAIVSLTDCSAFAERIERPDVPVVAMHKHPGKDPGVYRRLWKALRRLHPDIVHTRNLGTLDCMLPAWMSGITRRVHGEHGRDISDPEGTDRKKIWMRRLHAPLVHRFVAVSRDLERWLTDAVHIGSGKVVQIYNGVDCARFSPPTDGVTGRRLEGFCSAGDFVVGSVGRLDPIKDHASLLEAFAVLAGMDRRVRLVLVGSGSRLQQYERFVAERNLEGRVWLTGDRPDVAELLRCFDLFVQPSRAEGISNTVLEAMATGLPVVATSVGGNGELVEHGVSGTLVPSGDATAMSRAIATYIEDPVLGGAHGRAARERAERQFSLEKMVSNYLHLYDGLMGHRVR